MADRAGIFDDAADFDVSKFKPKPAATPKDQPSAEAVREVSEKASFQSREPGSAPARKAETAGPVRRLRRKRTGRTMQLNVKLDAQTLESFYEIADSQGWVLGETLERAIAALKRELTPAPK